ncbi:hypothetical protein D3C80_2228700 [compost metagenome]
MSISKVSAVKNNDTLYKQTIIMLNVHGDTLKKYTGNVRYQISDKKPADTVVDVLDLLNK